MKNAVYFAFAFFALIVAVSATCPHPGFIYSNDITCNQKFPVRLDLTNYEITNADICQLVNGGRLCYGCERQLENGRIESVLCETVEAGAHAIDLVYNYNGLSCTATTELCVPCNADK